MSEPFDDPMMPSGGPEPFYKIWIDALTKPNESAYSSLAASAEAKGNKAFLWVFITALIYSLCLFLAQGARIGNMMNAMGEDLGTFGGFGTSIIMAICGAPFGAVMVLLSFVISVGVFQWVAGLFGGKGSFGSLAYVMGAIMAPYLLISGLLALFSAIPYVGLCFSAILGLGGIYYLVLEIMAVKGVNQFGWGAAIGSVFLPGLVVGFLCACLVIGSLTLLGPAIGDVFSTINSSLGGY